jgi:phosphate transport system protein
MADTNFQRQHISGQFNAELDAATSHLLEMGVVVEKQVLAAVDALLERDSGDAGNVIDSDKAVNAMEVAIDDECFRILARRQPAAGDLRLVLAISKTIVDLERIGDEASRIARQAIALSEQPAEHAAQPFTRRITGIVTGLLGGALDAFARRDVEAALAIARGDEEIDAELSAAVKALADGMRDNPACVDASITVMWALRSLERVGDHARNIAEQVIYVVEGVDVRHAELDTVLEWLPGR